jgi:hypothetical protein
MLLTGCTGGSRTVTAANVEYPVSLTEAVYSKDLKMLNQKDYTIIKQFDFSMTKWSMLFATIPLSGDPDISDQLNTLCKENNADGIVNLTVGSYVPLYNTCNLITFVGPIIIPSSMGIEVKGDLFQINK